MVEYCELIYIDSIPPMWTDINTKLFRAVRLIKLLYTDYVI